MKMALTQQKMWLQPLKITQLEMEPIFWMGILKQTQQKITLQPVKITQL